MEVVESETPLRRHDDDAAPVDDDGDGPPGECTSEAQIDDEFYETLTGPIRGLALVGLKPFYFDVPRGPIEYLRENWWVLLSIWYMTMISILESGYLFFNKNKTFADWCASIAFDLYGIESLIKMYLLFYERMKYHVLFVELHSIWPKNLKGESQETKMKCIRQIRFVSPNYVMMAMVMVTFFCLLPLFFGFYDYHTLGRCTIRYTYYVMEPFSMERPFVYKMYFIFNCWAGYSACGAVCAQETVFQVASTQLAMHFKILCQDLTDLVRDEDTYSMFGNRDERPAIRRLGVLIEKHRKLLHIVELLEELYTVPNGLTVGCCTIIICCLGFVSTAGATSLNELIDFSFSACTIITQALLFSIHGHQIIEESEQLPEAIYNSKWYNAGPSLRRCLIITMACCQKPAYVTSMKFSPVSLKTFTAIAGRSWSFYTLLRTMYE